MGIEESTQRHIVLEKWVQNMMCSFCTASLACSPSLYFLIFGYGTPFFLGQFYLLGYNADDSTATFISTISAYLAFSISMTGIYSAFQNRELMRFGELQHLKRKTEQLLVIINSQKQPVIVTQSKEDDRATVVFHNSQSLELLGESL